MLVAAAGVPMTAPTLIVCSGDQEREVLSRLPARGHLDRDADIVVLAAQRVAGRGEKSGDVDRSAGRIQGIREARHDAHPVLALDQTRELVVAVRAGEHGLFGIVEVGTEQAQRGTRNEGW